MSAYDTTARRSHGRVPGRTVDRLGVIHDRSRPARNRDRGPSD